MKKTDINILALILMILILILFVIILMKMRNFEQNIREPIVDGIHPPVETAQQTRIVKSETEYRTQSFIEAQSKYIKTEISKEIYIAESAEDQADMQTGPKELSSDRNYDDQDAIFIAKTMWGEARGLNKTEQAAVAWCILNRVDSPRFPNTVGGVVTEKAQFAGYIESNPVTEDLMELAYDVLARWAAEPGSEGKIGRVLPDTYFFFSGKWNQNWFTEEYNSGPAWDWTLQSPYEESNT